MTSTYHNLSDYIQALNTWTNLTEVYKPGEGMFINVKGRLVPKAEFDAANPKPHYEPVYNDIISGKQKETLYGVRNTKQ